MLVKGALVTILWVNFPCNLSSLWNSFGELEWIDLKMGHQDSSPSNVYQGDIPYLRLVLKSLFTRQMDVIISDPVKFGTMSLDNHGKVDFSLFENKQIFSISNLTNWGSNKKASILQTTFSNAFPWKKTYVVWPQLHWVLFCFVLKCDNMSSWIEIMVWRWTAITRINVNSLMLSDT